MYQRFQKVKCAAELTAIEAGDSKVPVTSQDLGYYFPKNDHALEDEYHLD